MTHSKLDIDSILEDCHKTNCEVNAIPPDCICPIKQAKQALLEAFEQSLPAEKTTIKEMIKTEFVPEDDEEYMVTNNDFKAYGISARVHSWNAYRNEAIKVIRGNNE